MTKLNKAPINPNASYIKCENCVHFDKTVHTWDKLCTLHNKLVDCRDKCKKFERRTT